MYSLRYLSVFLGCLLSQQVWAIDVDSLLDEPDLAPGDGDCDAGPLLGNPTACTLRAAIMEANANTVATDDIYFADGGRGRIVLTSGALEITSSMRIHGAWTEPDGSLCDGPMSSCAVIDGVGSHRIFDIRNDTQGAIYVELNNLTIKDAYGRQGAGLAVLEPHVDLTISHCNFVDNESGTCGAAVYADANGSVGQIRIGDSTFHENESETGGGAICGGLLFIERSTFSRNKTFGDGGALHVPEIGSLTLINSTISNNQAGGRGGGIYADTEAVVSAASSTIVLNASDTDASGAAGGGGVFSEDGPISLRQTVLALNTDGGGDEDGDGPVTSAGYNFIGADFASFVPHYDAAGVITDLLPAPWSAQDPKLGFLADNGGYTETHLPDAAPWDPSPLLDAGDPACPTGADPITDQRGDSRPVDGDGDGGAICDIGSVER